MRALVAVLAVLLLVAICYVAGASLEDSRTAALAQKRALTETIPVVCCFNYVSRRIPHRLIHSAYWTSESCPNPAVVLVTNKGKDICVDPKASWVQEYLEYSGLLKH